MQIQKDYAPAGPGGSFNTMFDTCVIRFVLLDYKIPKMTQQTVLLGQLMEFTIIIIRLMYNKCV